ncbi:hypothetical protein [Nocardia nova]|uniref:hypothetical protein n=1 Tax=Nocardia nova TaxID=37330 RepID=UPI0011B0D0F9|nr:hypothetical protein [Nocardia nova]
MNGFQPTPYPTDPRSPQVAGVLACIRIEGGRVRYLEADLIDWLRHLEQHGGSYTRTSAQGRTIDMPAGVRATVGGEPTQGHRASQQQAPGEGEAEAHRQDERDLRNVRLPGCDQAGDRTSYITDIEYLSPSVAYRHHVILGMIFREPTLQGLFDVCPMTGLPAPETTAANGQ